MRHQLPHVALWILSRLVSEGEREPLVGDLAEEYALRASAVSSSAALKWCLRQVWASVPAVLWARLTRVPWISTIGVALLAYIAVGVVELTVNRATAYNPLGMLITFPMVVAIGYVAAGVRRSAPLVLAGMMLIAVTAKTLVADEAVRARYRFAYFFVGPVAAFIGTALRSLRSR
jgi:bacteriorhodopsin